MVIGTAAPDTWLLATSVDTKGVSSAAHPIDHQWERFEDTMMGAKPGGGPRLRTGVPSSDALHPRPFSELGIIVPAFNESLRIGGMINELAAYLVENDVDASITVVDNGSTDHTAEVVDGLGYLGVDIAVIGCARAGKGAAVRRGIRSTNSQFVGFCDADAATPADTLKATLSFLRSGSPIVIGSRRCIGSNYVAEPSSVRRVGGWAFRRLAQMHVKGVSDTQCGFKFFESGLAKRLFEETSIDGFAFDVEVLALAQARGFNVLEVPVQWTAEEGSTMRASAGYRAFRDIIRPLGLTAGSWST